MTLRSHPAEVSILRVGRRGYTMIELLVTMAVFAALASTAAPHFNPRRMQISAAHRLVIAKLRLARTNAITQSTHYSVAIPAATKLQYGPMNQTEDGLWHVDTSAAQAVTLPDATTLTTAAIGLSFEFNSRGETVGLTSPLELDVIDEFGSMKSLQVWPSGQINEM